MSELHLRFSDPAQRDLIAAAARAAGVGLEEFILTAAYERALETREHLTPSPPGDAAGGPRWLQGTYRMSHHY